MKKLKLALSVVALAATIVLGSQMLFGGDPVPTCSTFPFCR